MKVAIVYDRANKWGGAERVLLALQELFPDASLFTSVHNKKTAPWTSNFTKVIPSFLQAFPQAKSRHDLYAPLMPLAFESFDFSDYNLVISITSEAAKGIIVPPGIPHICYCLTPTRYLWSGEKEYINTWHKKILLSPVLHHLKHWDRIAAQRPDLMVGISQVVRDRIKSYYKRDSKLIYPPVNTDKFKKLTIKQGEYYLVVARLVPYKKVDMVVRLFNRIKKPLIIVGTGSEKDKLAKMANFNIQFAGFASEEELLTYYQHCKALIFPQDEDFGITALEAQAAGKPVIAFKSGGATETVRDGKTGVFFEKQTEESLKDAIEKFEKKKFSPVHCRQNAAKFSKEKFKKEFATLISSKELLGRSLK